MSAADKLVAETLDQSMRDLRQGVQRLKDRLAQSCKQGGSVEDIEGYVQRIKLLEDVIAQVQAVHQRVEAEGATLEPASAWSK